MPAVTSQPSSIATEAPTPGGAASASWRRLLMATLAGSGGGLLLVAAVAAVLWARGSRPATSALAASTVPVVHSSAPAPPPQVSAPPPTGAVAVPPPTASQALPEAPAAPPPTASQEVYENPCRAAADGVTGTVPCQSAVAQASSGGRSAAPRCHARAAPRGGGKDRVQSTLRVRQRREENLEEGVLVRRTAAFLVALATVMGRRPEGRMVGLRIAPAGVGLSWTFR